MSLPYETVVRLRSTGGGFDRYGDPIPGTDDETPIDGALVAFASSSEPVVVGRNSVITQDTLYLPEGTDALATDRFRVRGKEYEIEGEPADWAGAGVVVAIKKVTG